MPNSDPNSTPPKPPTLFQIVASVVSAAFGVQTEENRQRDFAGGNPMVYIIGGIVFTVVFIMSIVGIVTLVLP